MTMGLGLPNGALWPRHRYITKDNSSASPKFLHPVTKLREKESNLKVIMEVRQESRAVSQELLYTVRSIWLFTYTNENSETQRLDTLFWPARKCISARGRHPFPSRNPICLATMASDIAKHPHVKSSPYIHFIDKVL